MSDEFAIQAAFAFWRMDMWLDGYGTYDDIEWAVRWRILRPFRKPGRIRAFVAKRLINWHKAKEA